MPPRRRKPPRAGALTELPPLRIIRLIILLQLCYYATAFILILFTTLVLGQKFSLALVFDWKSVRGDNTIGWTIGFLWVVNGFIMYVSLRNRLLSFATKIIPLIMSAADSRFVQSNTSSSAAVALQTRPGLRFDDPFHPFHHYLFLHKVYTHESSLVGIGSSQCLSHYKSGRVGMSISRDAAYLVWHGPRVEGRDE